MSADHKHRPEPRATLPSRTLGIVLGLVIVLLAAWGIVSRMYDRHELKKTTEESSVPSVTVMNAPAAKPSEDVTLPGSVQAWHEAPIYARTSGYLKHWTTDIGAQVKEGDLLAEIDTPEVDAQLHQAEADLATAEANNALAQSTAKRWKNLLKTRSVSQQETDEKVGDADAKAALVVAAQANLDRLRQLEGFRRVVAPFDGVVTARNTDTGALINAGSGGTGPELFHVADLSRLRIYVQVPETYAGAVKPDMDAKLEFAEFPRQRFDAKLAETARALDPSTRTLLAQFVASNDKGQLLAGGYTQVHLKLGQTSQSVQIPVSTLIFRSQGLEAATVGDDNIIHLHPLVAGRDYGKEVEIVSGLHTGDRLVLNPPDSLEEGEKVRVVQPKQETKQPPSESERPKDKEEKKDGKDKAQ